MFRSKPKVFLSYRRDDAAFQTTTIHSDLSKHFGKRNVFMDVDTIPAGQDFREFISRSVIQCDVLVAVIGRQWLQVIDDGGNPRIEAADDYVRLEIEAAFENNIPVIPLLLDTTMPGAEELPKSLEPLAYRNAVTLRPGSDLAKDMKTLVESIHHTAKTEAQPPEVPPTRHLLARASSTQLRIASVIVIALFVAFARMGSEGIYDFISTFQQYSAAKEDTGGITPEHMPDADVVVTEETEVDQRFQWPSDLLPKVLGWSFLSGGSLGFVLWAMNFAAEYRWRRMVMVALVGNFTGFLIGFFLYDYVLDESNPGFLLGSFLNDKGLYEEDSITTIYYGGMIGVAYTFAMTVLLLLHFRQGLATTLALGFGTAAAAYCIAVYWLVQSFSWLTLLDGVMHSASACVAFAIAFFFAKLEEVSNADSNDRKHFKLPERLIHNRNG